MEQEAQENKFGTVRLVSLYLVDREPQHAGGSDQTIVVAGEIHDLSLLLKKVHGGEMKSIQSPHWFREWFQGARENGRGKLYESNSAQQSTHIVSMRP